MFARHNIILFSCLLQLYLASYCYCYFNKASKEKEGENCFCQLKGKIDDCSCKVDTVDHFNNVKIFPRLRSLLGKNYFRFYKVNLNGDCPFWVDDGKCIIKFCNVEPCKEDTIPPGLISLDVYQPEIVKDELKASIWPTSSCASDHDFLLGYLNTTISAKANKDFDTWKAYDESQDSFCLVDNADPDAYYVDLLLNPERYTGYKGDSAHRIWNSIYKENCFRPPHTLNAYIESKLLKGMCLEERAFYRAISGLHTSINIHLSAEYLLAEDLATPQGSWGPNVQEFLAKFAPENTNGEGPNWLKNLYFLYLIEMRALAKAAPYLEEMEFYTGKDDDDWDTRLAVKDFLKVVKRFPYHFDETVMFKSKDGDNGDLAKLKYEFKLHFRNITKIMDCVGCEKCKLWGKLQIQGLGTALKILYSEKFVTKTVGFHLERTEVVALINSVGRLSTSIYELDEFRNLLK